MEKIPLINKAAQQYNKTTARLNKDREKVISDLNSAYERFLAKHIPND
jgi:hypothetical protein